MLELVWTTEHAATLKALRQAAGLDVTVLAKRNNLSATQVRQLEDGGESGFYTPQIKWAVGRKLILALGGDFTEPTQAVLEEAQAAPKPAVNAAKSVPARTLVSSRSGSSPVLPPLQAAPAEGSLKHGGGLWLSSLGLGGVVLVGLVWVLHEPQRGPATPLVTTESPPAPPPLPAIAEPAPAAPGIPERLAATEPPSPAVPAARVSDSDECRWDARAPDLTPEAGSRPDNYVHVVAQETVTVCWRDADKKTRKQTLQAQEAMSFWGTPPFQVYASPPNALKVYFKGQAVRWPDLDTAQMSLGRRVSPAH